MASGVEDAQSPGTDPETARPPALGAPASPSAAEARFPWSLTTPTRRRRSPRSPSQQPEPPAAEPGLQAAAPAQPVEPPAKQGVLSRVKTAFDARVSAERPEKDEAPNRRGFDFDIWGSLKLLPLWYSQKLGQYPWAFAIFFGLALIIVVGAAWREVDVNTDLDAYYQADTNATMRMETYREALRHTREEESEESLGDRTSFQLEIFYEAKQGSVLAEGPLRDIRDFERELFLLDGWQRVCSAVDPRASYRCSPGETMQNYVWPTRRDLFMTSSGFFGLDFDGVAAERLPTKAVLAYLTAGVAAPHSSSTFLPQGLSGAGADSGLLRSVFSFTAPKLDGTEFREKYEDFVADELYPKLEEAVEKSREEADPDTWDKEMSVKIYFRGDMIEEHEVRRTLESDGRNASGCLVFSFLINWVYLRSFFLAFFGVWLLCMAPLLAYVLTPAVDQLGLATFLAVFLVFGLGSHSLIYITEAWNKSRGAEPVEGAKLTKRVLEAQQGALARISLTAISACSCLVLFLSLLRPLRELGLFLAVSLLCVCILGMLIFFPLLVLHEHTVRRLVHEKLPHVLAMILEPPAVLPPVVEIVAKGCTAAFRKSKYVILITASVIFVLFIPTVIVAATRDSTALPEIFPPAHHRTAGRPIAASFATTAVSDEAAPPADILFCEPGYTQGSTCGLHWCEAPEEAHTAEGCKCYSKSRSADLSSCSKVTVSTMLSGTAVAGVGDAELKNAVEVLLEERFSPTGITFASTTNMKTKKPSLVLENWASGLTTVEELFELPSADVSLAGGSGSCEDELICHCGERACEKPGVFAQETGDLLLNTSRRLGVERAASPIGAELPAARPPQRRLTAVAAAGAATEVVVVFGIVPPESSTFFDTVADWTFDDKFDPSSPAAQRAMYKVCTEAGDDLQVQSSSCWIADFRDWLIAKGQDFPTCRFCDFDAEVRAFLEEQPGQAAAMWLTKDQTVRATAFTFAVEPRSDAYDVLDDQQKWLNFIDACNEEAESTASQAWATSQAWVDSEAYDEALSSSWRVVLTTILAFALAGLAYTWDFELLATLSVVAVAGCIALSFLMYCIFQFDFGPWELVITTLLLCHTAEPAFRIGHDFVVFPWEVPEGPDAAARTNSAGSSAAGEEGDSASAAVRSRSGATAVGSVRSLAANSGSSPGGSSVSVSMVEGPTASTCSVPRRPDPADAPARECAVDTDDPEAIIERSVHSVIGMTLVTALHLFLCGIFLASCQFRLFVRLGVLAIVVPAISVPCTLLVTPAAILFTGRKRREPDCVTLWCALVEKTSWIFT